MAYEERVYAGTVQTITDEWGGRPERQLLVKTWHDGPHQRQLHERVLYELHPAYGGFGWSYDGGGTSSTATAVLADALDLDPVADGLDGGRGTPSDEILIAMREDFCADVLGQMDTEWRLSRGAVLRWARGWAAQRGLGDHELPTMLQNLPPVPDPVAMAREATR